MYLPFRSSYLTLWTLHIWVYDRICRESKVWKVPSTVVSREGAHVLFPLYSLSVQARLKRGYGQARKPLHAFTFHSRIPLSRTVRWVSQATGLIIGGGFPFPSLALCTALQEVKTEESWPHIVETGDVDWGVTRAKRIRDIQKRRQRNIIVRSVVVSFFQLASALVSFPCYCVK
jgi:hypothetical protein